METLNPFSFKRSRGIIWVYDLAKSSGYLNADETVDDIEEVLPRLYYVSKLLVESCGGSLFKWTGDGFISFFELELDGEGLQMAQKIFSAAWHLTFMSNITQFGLNPTKKFSIRHGITYEKDALLINPQPENHPDSWDVIGRSIVLAFRLSSVEAEFPSIVTVKELIADQSKFNKWKISKEEVLKYFKGEKFGTSTLFKSTFKVKRTTIKSNKKQVNESLAKLDELEYDEKHQIVDFANKMMHGPEWGQKIIQQEISFLNENLIGTLRQIQKFYSEFEAKTDVVELEKIYESINTEVERFWNTNALHK